MSTLKTAKTGLEHMAPEAARRHEGTVSVRATRAGFYDNVRREPGDVFTIPEGEKLGSWMERIEARPDPASAPAIPPAKPTPKSPGKPS